MSTCPTICSAEFDLLGKVVTYLLTLGISKASAGWYVGPL